MPPPRQVHELPVGVELALAAGLVSDPHRSRALVALERVDRPAVETALPRDAVEHLEVVRVPGRGADDEVAEGVRLGFATELGEGAGAEARITDP